jgi:hypothetical protein
LCKQNNYEYLRKKDLFELDLLELDELEEKIKHCCAVKNEGSFISTTFTKGLILVEEACNMVDYPAPGLSLITANDPQWGELIEELRLSMDPKYVHISMRIGALIAQNVIVCHEMHKQGIQLKTPTEPQSQIQTPSQPQEPPLIPQTNMFDPFPKPQNRPSHFLKSKPT